ncbi:hypothetical protein BDW75DRAFT_232847 [Aspergillus navahoensis]
MVPGSHEDSSTVFSALAQRLDSLKSIMTEDVDLIIHVDHRMITANHLTTQLFKCFPSDFKVVNQFRQTVPAYKLRWPGAAVQLVELEMFDYKSWPPCSQYSIQAAIRRTLNINVRGVKLFGPEWILPKRNTDIRDIINIVPLATPGRPELDFNKNQEL